MSSRLFQEVRENRGLCYTIFAQAGAYEDTGLVTVYAGTSAADIVALSDLTMDEIRRSAGDISEAEVARARAQMKAGMLMGLESPSHRAERLARMLAIWRRVPSIEEVDRAHRCGGCRRGRPIRGRVGCPRRGVALTLYGPAERAPHLAALKERLAA